MLPPLCVIILPIFTAAATAVGPELGYLFLGALLSAQLHCIFRVGKMRHRYIWPPPSLQASLCSSSTGLSSIPKCETGKATV